MKPIRPQRHTHEDAPTVDHGARIIFFTLFFVCFVGTVLSGFFGLCCGHTRFSQKDDFDNLAGSLFMNIFVGVAQFCTVVLCLVGWCWSIGWGVTMISIASEFSKAY